MLNHMDSTALKTMCAYALARAPVHRPLFHMLAEKNDHARIPRGILLTSLYTSCSRPSIPFHLIVKLLRPYARRITSALV
jgi:hypothetical protein